MFNFPLNNAFVNLFTTKHWQFTKPWFPQTVSSLLKELCPLHHILVSIFASASTESRICRKQNNLVSGRTLYLILSPSRNLLPIASLIDKHFPEYNNNIEWDIDAYCIRRKRYNWKISHPPKQFHHQKFWERPPHSHTHIWNEMHSIFWPTRGRLL